MAEEFHGIDHGNGSYTLKQLYGWGTLNANVWLPSLREFVGITGTADTLTGVYHSTMQGLNCSANYHVDAQGGEQFTFFKQLNTNGGGNKIWLCGGSHQFWLRSIRMDSTTYGWIMMNTTYFHTPYLTTAHAVHPAVASMQVAYRSAVPPLPKKAR